MLNVHITIDPIILLWGRRGVINRIAGVMVCVLASSAVDLGFEPRSGQTKDYIHVYVIGMCCFSAMHAA
jgi:hypothetical protein